MNAKDRRTVDALNPDNVTQLARIGYTVIRTEALKEQDRELAGHGKRVAHLISAGDHVAFLLRWAADAAYGRRADAPTPDRVNAVLTAWTNAAADAQ